MDKPTTKKYNINAKWQIKKETYTFEVVQNDIEERAYSTTSFLVGGTTEKCVDIVTTTIKPGEYYNMLSAVMSPYIASFNELNYFKECRIGGDLEKGEGTKDIIRSAFALVLQKMPHITHFKLTDSSSVLCESVTISLPVLSLLKYGKTWYEKHFFASLISPSKQIYYKDGIDLYNKTTFIDIKAQIPEMAKEYEQFGIPDKDNGKDVMCNQIWSYAQKTKIGEACMLASLQSTKNMFKRFFKNNDILRAEWTICASTVDLPSISITEAAHGGNKRRYKKNKKTIYQNWGGALYE